MGISEMERKACKKHMCNHKIYSLKDWRNEMLRLRKEHAPQYETHPDYIKMAQCKEDIVDKTECDALQSVPRPAPKPAPKPVPRPAPRSTRSASRSKPKQSKKSPPSGKQYEAYLEKMKQYEAKVEQLQQLKLKLKNFKEEIENLNANITTYKHMVAWETIQLKKKHDAIRKKELQKSYKNREKDQDALHKIMETLEYNKNQVQQMESYLKENEFAVTKLLDEIEVLAIQLEDKPVPPAGVSPPAPKRCPTGYKRNKTTKLCEKK